MSHTFRVWSPQAQTVAVETGGRNIPLHPVEGGWWQGDAPEVRPGDNYAFRVDGGAARPDPRSRWQPEGPHGPSRLPHPAESDRAPQSWSVVPWPAAVIYELHVGTFTPGGTFGAAIERLDHLVALGITHVEIMPVNDFPGSRGWGYDGVNWYAPYHGYGSPADLRALVDACHARGLAALLDVVYNHFGPDGNYLAEFGPYLTERYATVWGPALNLDGPDSDEVRRYVCDNALMWLREYRFDGLRLDATDQIRDGRAEPLLEQLAREVRALERELHRPLVLTAENDTQNVRLTWPVERGGYGMDGLWLDGFHHALHTVLTGERAGYYADYGTLGHLAKALTQAFIYDGCYSPFRRRSHGRPATWLSGENFVVCLQNHDQVGNRATGERIHHHEPLARVKAAAAIVLTSPFVPLIFQGEEWAASTPFQYFTDHEPELGRKVTEGRRSEFAAFDWEPADVPDPQDEATYRRSQLAWSELSEEAHADMLNWYRRLIALRRAHPGLQAGPLEDVAVECSDDPPYLRMQRGPYVVIVNFAYGPAAVPLPAGVARNVLLASHETIDLREETAVLAAAGVLILGPDGPTAPGGGA